MGPSTWLMERASFLMAIVKNPPCLPLANEPSPINMQSRCQGGENKGTWRDGHKQIGWLSSCCSAEKGHDGFVME